MLFPGGVYTGGHNGLPICFRPVKHHSASRIFIHILYLNRSFTVANRSEVLKAEDRGGGYEGSMICLLSGPP